MVARFLILFLCAAMLSALSQNSRADVHPGVDLVVERLTEASSQGASGVLRITLGGKLLLESAFGSASCREDEPVSGSHVFMIGSITKEYTRVLGYVLEEKGFFSLDDTVADVLPEFRGPIRTVTLQQLLDHTGGLPDIIDRRGRPIAYSVDYDYESVTRGEFLARASRTQLNWAPGSDEQYSNLGYQMLAALYEAATDETYPELLHRHIYKPAGIGDTDFWFSDSKPRRFADGCLSGGEHWGNPVDDAMWGESGPSWNLIGAGGLLSTAESLNKFFEGIGAGVYFESPEQLERYKKSRMVFSESRQQRVMGPAGSNGIFNAVGYWTDKDRFNVILMTNRADHLAEGGLFREIVRMFPQESLDRHRSE